MNSLQQLQPKDWITLVASLSAVTFSALSYWQRSSAGRMMVRKQLTDVVERLTDIAAEIAKYHAFPPERRQTDFPPSYVALLNDQRRFLVRQAEFLSRRIRPLVSPYEYLLIASAFDSLDDTVRAEEFFRLATDTSEAIDKGIALRSYAQYLFGRGLVDEARQKFDKALLAFNGDSDGLRAHRGHTCERWAAQERAWGDAESREHLLKRAIGEFSRLDNPSRRSHEVARINRQLASQAHHVTCAEEHRADAASDR